MALTHRPLKGCLQLAIQQLLARDGYLGASFSEDGLAIADLFDRIFVPPFGHLQGRCCRVELGARNELSFPERNHAIAAPPCFIEHGMRLAHQRRVLGIHAIIRTIGR